VSKLSDDHQVARSASSRARYSGSTRERSVLRETVGVRARLRLWKGVVVVVGRPVFYRARGKEKRTSHAETRRNGENCRVSPFLRVSA